MLQDFSKKRRKSKNVKLMVKNFKNTLTMNKHNFYQLSSQTQLMLRSSCALYTCTGNRLKNFREIVSEIKFRLTETTSSKL